MYVCIYIYITSSVRQVVFPECRHPAARGAAGSERLQHFIIIVIIIIKHIIIITILIIIIIIKNNIIIILTIIIIIIIQPLLPYSTCC